MFGLETFAHNSLEGRVLYRTTSISASMAFLLYGYDGGILGGVQNTAPFLRAIGNPTDPYAVPLAASAYVLGALASSLLVMYIGLNLGRRGCILLGDVIVIVGAVIVASSWSLAQMVVGRVICFISSTVPTYMAEMSIEHKERGPEVAIQCAWLISGVALGYWVDFGFTRMTNQLSWRFPLAFQSFFALASIVTMLPLPDTPRVYYAKGQHAAGDAVLSRLHALPTEHANVQQQKREILNSIALEEEEENKLSLLSLIWDNTELRVGRRIRISFLILSIQQMMGINLTVYYATKIFANVGLSPFLSQLLAAVMNTMFAAGTYFTPSTIERWGRRPIMMWSAFACFICMLIFTTMIGLPHKTDATQWTAVVFIVIYNLFFGWGWIGCPWLYGPEIAPLKYRHIAGAAGSAGEWLFSFITVFAGGIAIERVGWSIWIWQVLSCLLAVIFVYFCCPETAGRTLEEIDLLFAVDDYHDPASEAENAGAGDEKSSDQNLSNRKETSADHVNEHIENSE